ncbi:MAG: GH92 family glycosyl hydrolase, partial [Mameliella sp.]|nr:GH92 family glycosyl hydrolase [Phaeodactylibacter sp.]
HRYTFYTWDKSTAIDGHLRIDVAHTVGRIGLKDSRCIKAQVEIIGDNAIQGSGTFSGGWGGQNPYTVFFYAEFDRPFDAAGVWQDTTLLYSQSALNITFPEDQPVNLRRMGAWASFNGPQRHQVEARVGVSFKSIDNAREFLTEEKELQFDDILAKADQAWDSRLSRIQVTGGLPEHQRLFYSTLRNTFLMPTEVTGAVGEWGDTPHFWDHYCIWDVFRTVMPLHTLIAPEKQRAILQSLLSIYDKNGWLPDAWVAGNYGDIQGGTNVDVVFADAVVKKLGGFDSAKALEAMRKHAETNSPAPDKFGRYLDDYLNLGYVTSASTNGATSRSLEYAYNDFCIAQVAEAAGDTATARLYRERSGHIFRLFNKEAGHFWAKDRAGNWQPGITTENLRKDHWNDPYFYEASPLAYSSYVPHDMSGLIQQHGSAEAYIAYLDRLLTNPKFDLGNEPLFLLPYQYIYAGRPDKTAEIVQQLLRKEYAASANGLPGQDDSGAISSWFTFSAMGFFPVAGQDLYLIGSPLFDRSKIRLENGKVFEVIAKRRSAKNIYIQSAKLNGLPIDRAWFKHHELMQGGKLELVMGPSPSGWGKIQMPPSLSLGLSYDKKYIKSLCWNMVDYHQQYIFPKLNYVPVMKGAWTKNAYWNAATFYAGLWQLYDETEHQPFFRHMVKWGERERFTPLKYDPDIANNHLAPYTWMQLYKTTNNEAYLKPSLLELDSFMQIPYEGKTKWWWCDALFMAPPTFALASEITGDPKYLDFMHEKWSETTDELLDPSTGLFYRDKKYIFNPKDEKTHSKSGGKVFWSRGNGWVMGGIAGVLQHLPEEDPRRSYYIELLQKMAEGIKPLQGADGLWRVSLMDAENYPLPETSGTALFCYALAYGIRNGHIDENTYRPVMEKAWEGLLKHIRPDGSLGNVQRVGHAPEAIDPNHTEPFGWGA